MGNTRSFLKGNSNMRLHSNVIPFQKCDTDDDSPRFYAWRWARGAVTIVLMGFDDVTDGQTMLTFTPEVGVELGQSKVLAQSGEPALLYFKGTFEEQRDIFGQWDQLA